MRLNAAGHRDRSGPTTGYRLWVGGPVPPGADAITIGRTVIARRRVSTSPTFEHLLRHELTHVEQWRQLGHVRFLRRYVGEYLGGRKAGLRHHDAYLNISLEREARDRADGLAARQAIQLADVDAAHRRLERLVDTLTPADLNRASALPGWTVGHVIAHVICNARALTRVITAVAAGQPATLYDSLEDRAAGIEQVRALPLDRLQTEVHASNEGFETEWARTNPQLLADGKASAIPGSEAFETATVLHRRLREVEVHAADCGDRRYTYESWSDQFVNFELAEQWPDVAQRVPYPIHLIDETGVHHTTTGAVQMPARFATRRAILAWLLGRRRPDGFPEIGEW